jgi:tetratricopeptide (TPR) repeat protein
MPGQAKIASIPPPGVDYVRESELSALLNSFQEAISNRTAASVAVAGDPGMGISTLLRMVDARLTGKLPEDRITFLVCREPTEAFFPFSRILRDAFQTDKTTEANELRLSIATHVARLLENESAQIIAETTHLIGYVAGVPFSGSPILRLLQKDQELLYSRLKAALLRYFRADLKLAPAVLILDNAHTLQKGSREARLFIDMLRELRAVPFWTLSGGRSELMSLFAGEETTVKTITLDPLDDGVMRALFDQLLPKLKNPPEQIVTSTIQKAAGSPGALYELCSLLKESGAINTDGEVWTIEEERGKISEVLSDRRDALRVRLEQIDSRDKLVLQTAAIFGDVFWDEAIISMSRLELTPRKKAREAGQIWSDDSDSIAISSSIERLVERRFLVRLPDQDLQGTVKYAFSRSAIREKLLSTIDEALKRDYHSIAAEWLHHSASRHGVYLAELEAYHWTQAQEMRRAALTCFRAAEFARTRYLNPKAIELYKRGLALAGTRDRLARIDALHDLASIYELQGRLQKAEECLTEMLKNAWVLAHRNKAGAALNKIGRLYRLRGDGFAARAFLNRAMTLFRMSGDERGVAACLGDLGELARQEGSFDRAYTQVREAFEIQRKLKNRRSMAVCLQSLGNIEAARTRYNKAERFFNEALEMRRKTNDRAGMAQTLSSLALMMFNRGDMQKATELFKAALDMATEVGDRRLEAMIHNNLGEVYRERRRYKESMDHFNATEDIANAHGDRLLLAEVSRNMAILSLKNGDVENGRRYVARALELARLLNAREMEALAYRALGEIESTTMWDTSNTDGEDNALASFKKALDIFRSIGNQLEVARTLYALGNRMLERGNLAGSRKVLNEAKDIFERVDVKVSERIAKTISETSEYTQSI